MRKMPALLPGRIRVRMRVAMLSRRQLVLATAALVAASALRTPADAQQIVQIGRDLPERKPILDAVRAPVERLLGIKVIFVVERMTMFGDWAFAALQSAQRRRRPHRLSAHADRQRLRSRAGQRLCRRAGATKRLVVDARRACLPADRRRLGRMAREIRIAARAVPHRIAAGRDPARAPIPCAR